MTRSTKPRALRGCLLAVLGVGVLSANAQAEITIAAAARLSAPVVNPAFRGACGRYADLRVSADAMGRDNHTSEGHVFLQSILDMPMDARILGEARVSMPYIDLTHHRGACYSPGETLGGIVWPRDPTGSASGAVRIRGFLNVEGAAGAPVVWTMALAANDSTRVRIGGQLVLEEYWADSTRWKKFVHVRFPQPGVYALEVDNVTNHVCEIDPVELYFARSAIAGLDNVCACGAGCAFEPSGCGPATQSIVNRGPFQLVDQSVLLAVADGSVPPASAMCGTAPQVVDPGSPGTFLGCLSDSDCTGSTPVCSPTNVCVSGCGNSRLEIGEQCDDGNTTNGDGCSSTCTPETGYTCTAPRNVLSNSDFSMAAANWNAAGAIVETNTELFYGGRIASNITAEIDNGAPAETGPRSLNQAVTLTAGNRYALALRYFRRPGAPTTMRVNLGATGTNLGAVVLTATGPVSYRSTVRTVTATAAAGNVTITHDPTAYTVAATSGFGMIVDDVSLWSQGICTRIDTDMDGIPDLDEVRIGTDPTNPDTDMDGVPDGREVGAGPGFVPFDTDMDGMIDALDPDDDGDGVPTRDELGPGGFMMPRNTDAMVPAGFGTSDMRPDYLDPDDDGDGIPTRVENTLEAMGGAPDMDMVPAYLDLDSDGDGIPDAIEAGTDPTMPRNSDGTDRPDFLDLDSDNDTVDDQTEAGPMPLMPRNSNAMVPAGQGMSNMLPDYIDPDDDGDGIPTAVEVRLEGMIAGDSDMIPAYLDLDSDGDGVPDSVEAGADPTMPANSDAMAGVGDRPDFLDTDSDNDCALDSDPREAGAARTNAAVPNAMNNANCTDAALPICSAVLGRCVSDSDSDGDGIPNLDEVRIGTDPMNPDTDMDGVPDGAEVGPGPGFMPRDTDMDGIIDALDPDDDGDGVPTRDELGPGGFMMPRNTDAMVPAGMGMSDMLPDYLDPDDDGDGIPTRTERMLEGDMPADADMVPAYLDLDSDGDGVPDSVEAGADPTMPANSDMTDRPDFLDLDSDNDCVPDSDPREAGAARVDPAMPSMSADSNCMEPTPVCDRAVGVCMARATSDAGVDASAEAGAEAGFDASADASISGDAGNRMDASADGSTAPGVLTGDGACACRVATAGTTPDTRNASMWAGLCAMGLVLTARRRARRSRASQ